MMHSYLDGTTYRVCIVCLGTKPDHFGLGLALRQSLNQVHWAYFFMYAVRAVHVWSIEKNFS